MAWNFKNPWAKNQWASEKEQAKTLEQEWAEVDRREGEREKKDKYTEPHENKPNKGIFIANVTEAQIKKLVGKINKACGLTLPTAWYDSDKQEAVIYAAEKQNYPSHVVGQAFKLFLNGKVNFVNKGYDEVGNYDMFMDNTEQWINIEQLNACSQRWFFIYAITHPCREFLHAVYYKSRDYEFCHEKTFNQDIEIFDWMCKQVSNNPDWGWLEKLKQQKIYTLNEQLKQGEYIDNGETNEKDKWKSSTAFGAISTESSKVVLIKTYSSEGKWTKFELYNLKDTAKPIVITF